jgi:hypothetical protein
LPYTFAPNLYISYVTENGFADKHTLQVKIPTNRITAAGLIIALGIIYGDIGTSPLYVFNAIIGGRVVNEELLYYLDTDPANNY